MVVESATPYEIELSDKSFGSNDVIATLDIWKQVRCLKGSSEVLFPVDIQAQRRRQTHLDFFKEGR